jgi:hypothetical protein
MLISVDPSKGTLQNGDEIGILRLVAHLKIVIHALQYCQVHASIYTSSRKLFGARFSGSASLF